MAFVVNIEDFFAAAFQHMAAVRAKLNQSALVPASLQNFQIGGEFQPEAQIAPRIVVVPMGEDYDYSQQLPLNQDPRQIGRAQQRTTYRVWLNFDAYIWGDPDPTQRPNPDPTPTVPPATPSPVIGFNSTIELRRQFLNAISSLVGSAMQGWQPLRAEYVPASSANNRFGRLLVLSFRVASTNANEMYIILPFSKTTGDGGVVREITTEISAGDPLPTITVPP